jgi:hypothetical protein
MKSPEEAAGWAIRGGAIAAVISMARPGGTSSSRRTTAT